MKIVTYLNPNPNGKKLADCLGCSQRREYHAKGFCYSCYKKRYKAPTIICKLCGRTREHQAFGLCASCHNRKFHYHHTKRYNVKKGFGISLELYKELTKECASCSFNKIVHLHHLDGNRKNNESKNLVGLCPNCHKLIHSYDYYEEIKEILGKKGFETRDIFPTNYVKK